MATLRDIKRRIKSVQSTKQITKAMEMVAAAKLRKAQQRAVEARPYASGMIQVLGALASASDRHDDVSNRSSARSPPRGPDLP